MVKNFVPEIIMNWQTYACSQDSLGKLYFGGHGMIEFNGNEWIHHAVPGENIVRTVRCIGNRVYVGSYDEFGYFEADATGRLSYHSLSQNLSSKILTDCEIWEILEIGKNILFYSYNNIFIYDGSKVSRLICGNKHTAGIFKTKGHILIQFEDGSLHQLSPDLNLSPVNSGKKFPIFQSVMEKSDGERYFMTMKGLFLFQKDKYSDIRDWSTAADNILERSFVTDARILNDSLILVSTRRNGVLALNTDGKLMWLHNFRTGLCNNEVLSLFNDKDGNVWCSTDHGISLIYTSLPLTTLTPDIAEPQIGVVNGIAKHNGKIYLATSQGCYSLDMKTMSLNEILNTADFMWHANVIDNHVFIGGSKLTILNNNHYNTYNHENTSIIQSADKTVFFGTNYNGIRVYKAAPDGSFDESTGYMLPGFKATLHSVLEDYDGTLWATHIANGVFRIVLNHDKTEITERQFFPSLNSSNERRKISAVKLNRRVYLADADSLYSYSRETGEIHPYRKFCDDLPRIKQIKSISEVNSHKFWVATADGYYLIRYDGKHYSTEYEIPLKFFSIHNSGQNHNILIDNDDRVYFAATDGILLFNGDTGNDGDKGNSPVLSFARITTTGTPENEERLPIQPSNTPSVAGNITFNMTFVNYSNKKYKFKYSLKGNTSSVHISDNYVVSYGNLKPGKYIFTAELLDMKGDAMQAISYEFDVSAPLLLRPWMIVIYVICIIIFLYLSTRISLFYIERRKAKLQRQKQLENNLQTLQEENATQAKQKEMLEEKLNDKNKDLAALALNEVERGYRIEELQKALLNQKTGASTNEVEKLLHNIQTNSSDRDFWKILQTNFDLIHNNYFVRLRQNFPSLTPVDLRFCTLLRLNMNTKDIARMTNLSVRGVETARYRLRRKFGLDGKVSLTQFLIDFESKSPPNTQDVV